jgi:hypothetical protein
MHHTDVTYYYLNSILGVVLIIFAIPALPLAVSSLVIGYLSTTCPDHYLRLWLLVNALSTISYLGAGAFLIYVNSKNFSCGLTWVILIGGACTIGFKGLLNAVGTYLVLDRDRLCLHLAPALWSSSLAFLIAEWIPMVCIGGLGVYIGGYRLHKAWSRNYEETPPLL